MLQYLIILLDDNAPSFCYYPDRTSRRLMPLDVLKKAVRYSMAELHENRDILMNKLKSARRINVVLTDAHKATDADMALYRDDLEYMACRMAEIYAYGGSSQLNLCRRFKYHNCP